MDNSAAYLELSRKYQTQQSATSTSSQRSAGQQQQQQPQHQQLRPKTSASVHGYHTSSKSPRGVGATSGGSSSNGAEFDSLMAMTNESMTDISTSPMPSNYSANSLRSVKNKSSSKSEGGSAVVSRIPNGGGGAYVVSTSSSSTSAAAAVKTSSSIGDLKSASTTSNGGAGHRVKSSKSNWAKFKSRLVKFFVLFIYLLYFDRLVVLFFSC